VAGRPKKNIDVLPDKWQKSILDLYREGASDVEIRAWLYDVSGSFSTDLWTRWINEEPEFSKTIKKGKDLSQAWWEKQGRIALRDKTFSPVLWYMNMKNRFGWRDTENQMQLTDAELLSLKKQANTQIEHNL
jgi:hypothetical protein